MSEEGKPEFTPPAADGEPGAPRSAIPEALRKAVLAGMGALFLTEEGARRMAREWKLPGELIGYLGQQAKGARDELMRVFSDELRRFLESDAVRREFLKALSSTVIEVKAEIRLRPADEAGGEGGADPEEPPLKPHVKAEVKARRAQKKPAR